MYGYTTLDIIVRNYVLNSIESGKPKTVSDIVSSISRNTGYKPDTIKRTIHKALENGRLVLHKDVLAIPDSD